MLVLGYAEHVGTRKSVGILALLVECTYEFGRSLLNYRGHKVRGSIGPLDARTRTPPRTESGPCVVPDRGYKLPQSMHVQEVYEVEDDAGACVTDNPRKLAAVHLIDFVETNIRIFLRICEKHLQKYKDSGCTQRFSSVVRRPMNFIELILGKTFFGSSLLLSKEVSL